MILSSLMLMLWGCDARSKSASSAVQAAPGEELLCMADSEEEAKRIAELYQIELIRYGDGVAVFHTEEDPRAVIERGVKESLPGLSINRNSYRPQ